MKIKDCKCKCGHDEFFIADNTGNQKGIYCSYCGKWLKWANKDEQNLKMKQVSVLDKIRADITKLQTYKMSKGEDTVYVGRDDVLAIIDKYKESEGKE